MSKLNKHKFSDLYEISSGISSKPKQAGHGAPFLSFSTVFNNYFLPEELDEKMDTSPEEQKKYSIKKGDIFLTRTSETLDELGMSSVALKEYPKATYSGFLKRLRPTQNDVTYHKYLAFYLRAYLFRKSMNYKAVMTLRASLNEKIFSYLDLLLPSYSQQKKIGDFLYSIEEKINLNKKINKEFEKLIKLIYKYWFVQFDFPDENGRPYKSSGGEMVYSQRLGREIPKGWKVCDLEKVAEVKKGDMITSKETNEGKVKVVAAGVDFAYFHSESNRNENTITISSSGANAGYINFWREKIFASDCTTVRGNSDIDTIIIYHFLDLIQNNINSQTKGSAQSHVYPSDIKSLPFLRPENSIKEKFESVVIPLNKKIRNNLIENKKLKELRDWLLPMLVNGQVAVQELDAFDKTADLNENKNLTNVDYYKRIVLAAEIVWQLHKQPTLGHLKLQKLIYLAQQANNMNLPTNFLQQAAGPYDPRMARSIDKQLKKKNWFEYNENGFFNYKPLVNAGEHREDFDKYFSEEKEDIQYLINTFKKAKSSSVEIAATLYACWKELLENEESFSEELLIEKFYSWSDEKAKYEEERLKKAISWMREKGIVPSQELEMSS